MRSGVKRLGTAVLGALAFASAAVAIPEISVAQDRTLYLYYTHTGETARITFRRNGNYDRNGLRQLNQFLRDWRRGESTEMDPALFDLIWQVYQDVGGREPIHVVSAYRAPETNEMLRSRSSAVAKDSRHTMGMAMDFFIPGIPISKIREAGFLRQVGGVGYYPTSGSPFVHLDTGNVRAWPRMSTSQLRQLFPDGKTLHLGADGTIISQSGRQYAAAEWQKCHSVPCNGGVANTMPNGRGGNSGGGGGSGRTLFDILFGGEGDDNDEETVVASNQGPAQRQVTSVSIARPATPPIPMPPLNPLSPIGAQDVPEAPTPFDMPEAVLVAMRAPGDDRDLTVSTEPATALDAITPAPLPRTLLSDQQSSVGLLSAYAPLGEPEPDAQRALEMLIERRGDVAPTEPTAQPAPLLRGAVVTASLAAPVAGLPQISGTPDLFSTTFAEVIENNKPDLASAAVPQAPAPLNDYSLLPVDERAVEFYSPDIDELLEAPLTTTDMMSGQRFAVMFEPDTGDLAPMTELGPHAASMAFASGEPAMFANHFTVTQPTFVAAL